MAELSSAAVKAIIKDCLYRDDELERRKIPDGAVIAEGLVRKFVFHPKRLVGHKAAIAELLAELPREFQSQPGGESGWSFLNACNDKHGRQWGEQMDMEALFSLGVATGQAEWLLKDCASSLPGGVPYVVVLPAADQN